MMTLQQHMLDTIGQAIANPVIDGRWHSGKPAQDGKGADKISYVGHYLPKGLLVRYRHHKSGDECHTWKEWDGGAGEYIDPLEYRRKREEAQAKADAAAQQSERDRAALLAILQTVISESVPADHNHSYPLGKRILALAARQALNVMSLCQKPHKKRNTSPDFADTRIQPHRAIAGHPANYRKRVQADARNVQGRAFVDWWRADNRRNTKPAVYLRGMGYRRSGTHAYP